MAKTPKYIFYIKYIFESLGKVKISNEKVLSYEKSLFWCLTNQIAPWYQGKSWWYAGKMKISGEKVLWYEKSIFGVLANENTSWWAGKWRFLVKKYPYMRKAYFGVLANKIAACWDGKMKVSGIFTFYPIWLLQENQGKWRFLIKKYFHTRKVYFTVLANHIPLFKLRKWILLIKKYFHTRNAYFGILANQIAP